MNGNASDTSIFPAVSVTTVPAPADAAANRRMTLVVDRDSHRGLSLAIAVLASPDGAPVSTVKGIPPSTNAGAAAAIDVTVISRDRQLSCDVDSTGLALRLVALDDGESESDQYGGLKHTGTVAEPRGALVLDNPPTDQSQELVEFQRRFLSVVIISAYPVFRPGVDAIVASPAANEFLWPTLYDAFFSTNGMAVKDEFTTMTRKLADNSALCLLASSKHAAARTWSISTMAARQKPLIVEPPPSLPPSLTPSPLPAPIFA